MKRLPLLFACCLPLLLPVESWGAGEHLNFEHRALYGGPDAPRFRHWHFLLITNNTPTTTSLDRGISTIVNVDDVVSIVYAGNLGSDWSTSYIEPHRFRSDADISDGFIVQTEVDEGSNRLDIYFASPHPPECLAPTTVEVMTEAADVQVIQALLPMRSHRIDDLSVSNGLVRVDMGKLGWGLDYELQRSCGPLGGTWSNVHTFTTTATNSYSWTDAVTNAAFYRLQLIPP